MTGPVLVSMVMMASLAFGICAQHASLLAAAIGLFGFWWAVIELRKLSRNSCGTLPNVFIHTKKTDRPRDWDFGRVACAFFFKQS